MEISRKLDIAKRAILSISRHDDETKDVIITALSDLVGFINAEGTAFVQRKDAAKAQE